MNRDPKLNVQCQPMANRRFPVRRTVPEAYPLPFEIGPLVAALVFSAVFFRKQRLDPRADPPPQNKESGFISLSLALERLRRRFSFGCIAREIGLDFFQEEVDY